MNDIAHGSHAGASRPHSSPFTKFAIRPRNSPTGATIAIRSANPHSGIPSRRQNSMVATATPTPGEDPRFGAWGKQKCEDTGPLTKKRMETVDTEFLNASFDFMDRAQRDKKPFFMWFNTTRMHIWTHLKPESQNKTGLGVYADGMVEHDGQVGDILKKIDDLKIADNTIVIYTTDNGAEAFTWPDGGTTMFRGEKNTQWEGGFRVPTLIRWPGIIKPGTVV